MSSGSEADENIAVLAHRKILMNRRVRQLSRHMADIIPGDVLSLLDVGAGTGEMARAISGFRPELNIVGVDVYVRPKTFIPVVAYDGNNLPFDSGSLDAVMAIDVLHHCDDPVAILKECARVSKKWIVIKDHVSDSPVDNLTLRLMDWIGNRAHGVALPYNYFSSSDWKAAYERAGLIVERKVDDLGLYPMPFDLVFGGYLHCLYLFRKK